MRPSASCRLRSLTVIEARPFTLPPGSELTTTPWTVAPRLAITQSPSTMGRARLAVKRSPSLAVLVERSLAVEIVICVPARIVKARGGGAGAALGLAAAFEATAPGLLAEVEAASGVGDADVNAVATLGEGLG